VYQCGRLFRFEWSERQCRHPEAALADKEPVSKVYQANAPFSQTPSASSGLESRFMINGPNGCVSRDFWLED
jgi:hypothetical protein